ncbi:ABC transporter permease [Bacteroides sp. UBA939]|uniref:ABC transporter permease n=1 Tax=Bacteroides sp. UBA939 TaxID=1946092 RepID=UPI0025BE641E|nr:ABC transporter permease [Bacteroides sp. UBA939]
MSQILPENITPKTTVHMKNLHLAIRSLIHFKLYSAVNVFGLALSLACVIVIVRYVHSEMTIDHFNSRLDRIYVTTVEFATNASRIEMHGIKNYHRDKDFIDLRPDPAIERWSNFILLDNVELLQGENQYIIRMAAVDTSFLQILDYPVINGSGDVSAPDNLLITEEFARKVFGDRDPLGRQLTLPMTNKSLTVTGIIGSTRTKSSMEFEAIIPYSHTRNWAAPDNTLVLLHPNQDYRALNERYSNYFVSRTYLGASVRFQLFPLKKVYLDTTIPNHWPYKQGVRSSIIVLSLVGLLIGLVGIFNFINIYTAVVLRRGREFGMKKVFGAPGRQVFLQLFIENILMIGLALVIALALTEVLNPAIRNLLGIEQIPFRRFDFLLALGLLAGLPVVTTAFPFVHYNYAAPIKSLQSVGKTGGRGAARQVFLVFQYVLTIGMIAVSLLFLKQLRFMLNADPGYTTENIIRVPFIRNYGTYDDQEEAEAKGEMIFDRIASSPLFTGVSSGWNPVGSEITINFRLDEGDSELKPLSVVLADENWMKLFGIELTQGRMFNAEQDNFRTYHLLLTESALPYMGITDINADKIQPERRLWHVGDRDMQEEMKTNPAWDIVGVVKDFHTAHLGHKVPPMAVVYGQNFFENPIMAKIAPGRSKQEAIEFMQALHQELIGGEFTYSFIEDDVAKIYDEDRKVATIYSLFTAIAIGISVLGLFSLSLFDVQLRQKEIAIRKVNGATTAEVLAVLLKRYMYLLGIAFVIAAPVAWFAIHRYLEGFAFRTALSWWIFAVALVITAGVSLLTLIWQTRKAASANPAWVIRSE